MPSEQCCKYRVFADLIVTIILIVGAENLMDYLQQVFSILMDVK